MASRCLREMRYFCISSSSVIPASTSLVNSSTLILRFAMTDRSPDAVEWSE